MDYKELILKIDERMITEPSALSTCLLGLSKNMIKSQQKDLLEMAKEVLKNGYHIYCGLDDKEHKDCLNCDYDNENHSLNCITLKSEKIVLISKHK